MSTILKFFGAVVIVLSLLGAVGVVILMAIGTARFNAENPAARMLVTIVGGGIGSILYFAGGMATGAVLFVGGRALDHMERARSSGRFRRPLRRPEDRLPPSSFIRRQR